MLQKMLLLVAVVCFIAAQSSTQKDNERQYKHNEKYALIQFAAKRFLRKNDITLDFLHVAFFGNASYKKESKSPKKFLSLYEVKLCSNSEESTFFQNQIATGPEDCFYLPLGNAFSWNTKNCPTKRNVEILNTAELKHIEQQTIFLTNALFSLQNRKDKQLSPKKKTKQFFFIITFQMGIYYLKKFIHNTKVVLEIAFLFFKYLKKLFYSSNI